MQNKQTFLDISEKQLIPSGQLLQASWKREDGEVLLSVKSKEIHDFFAGLPPGEPSIITHKGWKLEYYNPETLPRISDVSLEDLAQTAFYFQDTNKGGFAYNLSFLRAKKLAEGVEVRLGPLMTESDLQDMKKILKMTAIELYRNYMADFEEDLTIEIRQAIKVA